MLNRNEINNLIHKKLTWNNTGDPAFPWSTTIDGQLLKIRINDFPEKDLYSLILDDDSIIDFNDWPQQWEKNRANTSWVPSQSKGIFFSQKTSIPKDPQQLIELFVKNHGNDPQGAVNEIITAIVYSYPHEFSTTIMEKLAGDLQKKQGSKL